MEDLCEAAEEWDAETVRAWLTAHPNANLNENEMELPLSHATRCSGFREQDGEQDELLSTMEALLAAGASANVNPVPPSGPHRWGSLAHGLISEFDDHGRRLDASGRKALAALARASSKATLNGKAFDGKGETALHCACKAGDLKAAAILLRAGADPAVTGGRHAHGAWAGSSSS